MAMTEELLQTTIREMIEEKAQKGIGPSDQVTLLELLLKFPGQTQMIRTTLNGLWKKKVIKVGPTMNGTYIKFRV